MRATKSTINECTQMKDNLPKNWTITVIGNLIGFQGIFCDGDWVESKDQDQNGNVRLVQLADIGDGIFKDKSSRFLTNEKAIELNCTFLNIGDVLVARMPDPLGRACLFPLLGNKNFVTVVDVCIVRFGHNYLDAKYFMHMLNSPVSRRNISGYQTGSTRKRISRGNLSIIPFPVAPLTEQHRIVAKIEALFSELDKGIESLKTAREQLKVYRQALLKHAFSGKLTAQWRIENPDKLETSETLLQRIQAERQQHYQQQLEDWEISGKQGSKPKAPKVLPSLTAEELAELPELPKEWVWVRLADISDVSGGLAKNSKISSGFSVKRPFLRVGNVYANRLELEDIHLIGVSDAEFDRFMLVKNDILIVEGNGSADQIGRAAIWNGKIDGCIHQNHLIKARPLNLVISEFILYFLMSELGRKFIVRAASSTSGLYTLNIFKIQNLFIPFSTLYEQNILINELAVKFSLADQLDQTITTVLQQSEVLRQSILKKAFSGQLVPQDPNDEPASVLLERIQAEKAALLTRAKTVTQTSNQQGKLSI